MKIKLPYLFAMFLSLSAFQAHAASSTQTVIVKGSIMNTATNGGTAKVNIGSVVGVKAPPSVSQTVSVTGNIINVAEGKSKAEVNIGSIVK